MCLVALIVCASCGGPGNASPVGSNGPGGDGPGERVGPGAPAGGAGAVDAGAGLASSTCAGVLDTCAAWNVRHHCASTDAEGMRTWVDDTCSGACFDGKCVQDACSDECALGETQAGKTCRLYALSPGAAADPQPATSMHDRARGYEARLRKYHLPTGSVLQTSYSDATYTNVVGYGGSADSALWTGTALAAEGFRAIATGSADAAARIAASSETIHRHFGVTGVPGYLARFVAKTGAAPPGISFTCANQDTHCGVAWNGQTYDWKGETSRDQYSGVMLGSWLAWEATPDDAVRASLRDDLLVVVEELMKRRSKVPAQVVFNGLPVDTTLDLENVILAPASEQTNGKVVVNLSTSNTNSSDISGIREFLPDYGAIVKQLPLIGFDTSVPRPGSAIMLGAFFRMALRMTDGVASLASRRAVIASYFDAHADQWLTLGEGYQYGNTCGAQYYGIHIEYIAAYAWASLETDPTRAMRIRDHALGTAMWTNLVATHKNPYFAFLWAGTRTTAPDVSAFATQLGQFPPAPRVFTATDVVAKYPHDGSCTSAGQPQAAKTTAVDVGDRVVADFLWQRHPWGLYGGADPLNTAPGVDYLVAYWAGRRHGALADDRKGTCTRWLP